MSTLVPEQYVVDGILPKDVAFPKTAEDVSELLREAAKNNWAVVPRGGGTMMGLGNIPRAVDLVVCTTQLNQVLEYEPADLVVTVQAGITLAELQRILGEQGQILPLDPPVPERATIGGIIAANSSGPLRLRYGTCRDVLIGIKVVGADGSISKGGGKVVKNVTGYDMTKLYTGSLGTLGIIVEASFKLAPQPAQDATVLAAFQELSVACDAARAIYKSGLPVRACELLSPGVVEGAAYQLAVWIGGGQVSVTRQTRDVQAFCSASSDIRTVEGDEGKTLWRRIEDFGRGTFHTIAKASVVPSRTRELLAALGRESTFVSHVLSGVTYVFGANPEPLAETVARLGGYLVLEACPVETKQRLDVWGPVGPDFRLMERIKHQFDPQGILNPGRYVGRL